MVSGNLTNYNLDSSHDFPAVFVIKSQYKQVLKNIPHVAHCIIIELILNKFNKC